MKKLVQLILAILLCILLHKQDLLAQSTIKGVVSDDLGESLIAANVELLKDSILVKASSTDIDGNYSFTAIDTGTYQIKCSYIGYRTQISESFKLSSNNEITLDFSLPSSPELICYYYYPTIELQDFGSGRIFTAENIRRMAIK